VAETEVEQLQSMLSERHHRLAALPDVVGWGVGLGTDGHPIVQVFVSAPPTDKLVAELGRVLDRFDIVVQSRPAEAD
jgi:hypothetical protein